MLLYVYFDVWLRNVEHHILYFILAQLVFKEKVILLS